jgi:hypothetical protein
MAAPLLLVSGAAIGTFSVVRYRWWIVVAYVVLLALLLEGLRRNARGSAVSRGTRTDGREPTDDRGAGRLTSSLAIALAGVLVVAVPGFTYLPEPRAAALRHVLLAAAALSAALIAVPRRWGPDAALTAAAAGYLATAAAVLRLDPAPRIDVWYTLQGAADGLLTGQDMYSQAWVGPPGPMAAFTYLPWTAVVLAPGRWLFGDVRWVLVAITLCTCLLLRELGRRSPEGPWTVTDAATLRDRDRIAARRRAGCLAGCLVLLLPGTLTQVEQAWTEPLLLACLAGAVVALGRDRGPAGDHDSVRDTGSGRGWPAVALVALALASKQHVALLLPVLAAWPRFGVRRCVLAVVLAGTAMLPWFVANPAAMWHDTVRLLVDFPPLKFADTVYIAALDQLGVRLPFWVTGAVVVGTVAAVAVIVRRTDPPAGVLLRWCAATLLVANLMNKQAFYNQYWLVAGLVILSWAAGDGVPHGPTAERRTAHTADEAPASNRWSVAAWSSQLHSRRTQSRPARP